MRKKLQRTTSIIRRGACAAVLSLGCSTPLAVDLGSNNWSWGKEDTLGAGNLMTAETIKAALKAVEKGEIIELSHDVAMGAPHISPIQTPYVMTMSRTSKNMEKFLSENMGATNDIGFYLRSEEQR